MIALSLQSMFFSWLFLCHVIVFVVVKNEILCRNRSKFFNHRNGDVFSAECIQLGVGLILKFIVTVFNFSATVASNSCNDTLPIGWKLPCQNNVFSHLCLKTFDCTLP